MKQADIAMFEAKRAGRDQICQFERSMQRLLEDQEALVDALRRAMEQDALRLLYQPQVDAEGRWTGLEAIIVWERGSDEPISRDLLLTVAAEAADTLKAIGLWSIRAVVRDLDRYRNLADTGFQIGVAISAPQFANRTFIDEILELMVKLYQRPCPIRLELPEQVIFSDLALSAESFRRLRSVDMGIGLGGFSSGFASLALIKRLPLETLKISSQLVERCGSDPTAVMLLRSAIAVGGALSIPVIADGIRCKAEFELLRREGCTRFQGDYLEPPMPIEELARRLSEQCRTG
jgi:EAL domain-containing protein (putative c-di-GMP-specific phosphodiesterase class I)